MTNKPMEQRISEAFGSLTTNLPFERIAQAIPDAAPQPMPTARRRYAPIVAVAACAALVLALGGLWHHLSAPESPDSDSSIALPPVAADGAVIDIDVNPSVEITVDTAACISAVTAVLRTCVRADASISAAEDRQMNHARFSRTRISPIRLRSMPRPRIGRVRMADL